MARAESLRRVWGEGRTAFGMWATIPGFFGAEILAGSGVDYVCVDQQHGLIGFDAALPMFAAIRGAGAAPITRVTRNDLGLINKSLDGGAVGVIIPLVNTPEDATRAVAACRYPPHGVRSYGPMRAANVIGSGAPEDLEREALCFVMIETRQALEQVDEIAATPGLDGIYIGPADLAFSLGLTPTLEVTEDIHIQAVRRIKQACDRHGIVAGIHSPDGEWAKRHAEAGFQLVTVAMDSAMLREATLTEAFVARAGQGTGDPGTPA